jgi:hypothetical protein
MGINPNIILGIQPAKFQLNDPLESASKSLALQHLMGQQDMQAMAMKQAQQAEADDLATRDAFKAGGERSAIVQRLLGAGQWKAAQAVEKAGLETDKAKGDIAKTTTEIDAAKAKQGRDLIASASPQNYQTIIAEGRRLGQKWAENAPAEFDPVWQRQNVIGADKWLEVNTPKIEFKSDNKTNRAFDMNPFTNPNIGQTSFQMLTTPGEDLTDARQRELAAAARAQVAATRDVASATREANATTYDADRGVLVNRATGEARPAMLGGQAIGEKDKPLNDAQAKALLFSNRMRESDKIITDLAGKGTNVSVPGSRSGVFGSVINAASPESQQSLDQAKRDFINAVLRRESGAVIADSEFSNAEKQYFPQVGEGPKIIAQKAANRKNALDSITQEVPEKKRTLNMPARPSPQMVPGATRAGPVAQPGGVKFLGFE